MVSKLNQCQCSFQLLIHLLIHFRLCVYCHPLWQWQQLFHRKKSRFFKVFKVAGKKCITTVSKENNEKKVTTRPWWISTTKSSTIRWWIQAYEWSKWPVDNEVESHQSGILFYWKLKKLEQYDGTICILLHCDFYKQEWSAAPSIFNIKARGLAHCLY